MDQSSFEGIFKTEAVRKTDSDAKLLGIKFDVSFFRSLVCNESDKLWENLIMCSQII